jgi:PPOX class probable F420-dependent enzyme
MEAITERGGIERAAALARREAGLAVVVTQRADGSAQASIVNAGVVDHPVTGRAVVGFVARSAAHKVANLRARPCATVVFRSGWEWVTVEGEAELVGPADALDGIDGAHLPELLRRIYTNAVAGCARDDAEVDQRMAAHPHTAVLVRPTRVYSNPVA